jgi:chromosome segregation ATPase
MAPLWALILVAPLVDGATLHQKVSPVQKVIQLLEGLKVKVAAELQDEEKMMAEYVQWCDDEAREKDDAISTAQRTITDLAATIEDASGTIATLQAETEELGQTSATSERDLEAATSIRKKEHADFEATEKEMSEAVDVLERAMIVLKRGQTAFLQGKGKQPDLGLLVSGLSKVVAAAWVNSDQRAAVQNLLLQHKSSTEEDDEDLSLQPQATVAAYESKGGSILEILGQMQEQAQEALSSARRTEMEEQHAFEMLKQGLTTQLAQLDKRLTEVSTNKMDASEQMHGAQGEKSSTEEGLANDQSYLKELRTSCSAKSEEWELRKKSAADEQVAIDKAIEILRAGKSTGLMQVTKDAPAESKEEDKRDQVVKVLSALATSEKVYALQQLAAAARSDPFEKVKNMISDLITRLMDEAAEEADSKGFCDSELEKTKAKQTELSAKLDRHSVRIEKAASSKALLGEQVQNLHAELAELDAGQARATKIRQEEHAAYLTSSAQYKEAASAIADAMQVLQKYYSSASFVQVKKSSQPSAPEFGSASGDVASTIMGLLEVAESDFTRLLSESEAEEAAAKTAFETLSQDNAVTKAAKLAEAKAKDGEIKTIDVQLLNSKEDHVYVSEELTAVMAYLDKLKPQCETKVMTYGERKARREQEIAGLKEALEILG